MEPQCRFTAICDSSARQVRFRRSRPLRASILRNRIAAVSEIVAATGATQSNISKHLSLLASAGVITIQKDGLFVYYEMSNPLTMKLCELVHKELLKRW